MSRLVWDAIGDHRFETGTDRGVLYVGETPGVPWNGLISVSESSGGGGAAAFYADNTKFMTLQGPSDFEATIQAYTYPDEFLICDGTEEPYPGAYVTEQDRAIFGLSYRTLLGNDVLSTEFGYKLHLVYNATANPSEKAYSTVNDSMDVNTFSWDIQTLPVDVPNVGIMPTAHVVIDTTRAYPGLVERVEASLYGTLTTEPRLPEPLELFEDYSLFRVIDNHNGTVSIFGQDEFVEVVYGITVNLDYPTVVVVDDTVTLVTGL